MHNVSCTERERKGYEVYGAFHRMRLGGGTLYRATKHTYHGLLNLAPYTMIVFVTPHCGLRLQGHIPPELARLRHVQSLYLYLNKLSGESCMLRLEGRVSVMDALVMPSVAT